ncbi:MAG TPA: hypothetical protein VGS17_02565, partial [Candidatus Limnocylindria bacterium]|nr:hypothetical protein [Candidatus Limnocylindria bacterium]
AAGPPLLLISVRPGLRGTTRSSVTPMIGACADGQLPDVSETTRNFTYSITNGIGAGFLAYTFLKLVSGKTKDVSLPMWFAALAFLIYFADPLIRKFLG